MIAGFFIALFKMLVAAAAVIGIMFLAVKLEMLDVFFEMGQTAKSALLVIVGLSVFFWGVWAGLVWMMW